MRALPQPLTVSQVNAHIAGLLRADDLLADCSVRGELSNWRRYSSGHCYFTLKDAGGELRGVMFRREAESLRFEPSDGLAVVADGRIDVYEKRGEYQLYARALRPDGLGTLFEAFERLKAKLAGEGLFDPARKQPLPRFPRRVAVITSPSGAAVRDLCRILSQRWPAVRILVEPAVVQGAEAAGSLVTALERVQRAGGVDLVIIGRGGGSLEDLWAFNEEPVVRAVAACTIPIISAVGHETDTTLCDFAADARAATPSHAAEMAVPDARAVRRGLAQVSRRLQAALARRLELARARFDAAARRLRVQHPERRLALQRQALDDTSQRLARAMAGLLAGARHRLEGQSARLGALDPAGVLRRGFAILFRAADGVVVTRPSELPAGAAATAQLAHGELRVLSQGEPE